MPFKSYNQMKYLFAREPEVAERWIRKYGTPKKLSFKERENGTTKRPKRQRTS